MSNHQRVLLQLIAIGRISPAEAERLLIAGNEGRGLLWVLCGCMVIAALSQAQTLLPGLLHAAGVVLKEGPPLLHRIALLLNQCLGGIQ